MNRIFLMLALFFLITGWIIFPVAAQQDLGGISLGGFADAYQRAQSIEIQRQMLELEKQRLELERQRQTQTYSPDHRTSTKTKMGPHGRMELCTTTYTASSSFENCMEF